MYPWRAWESRKLLGNTGLRLGIWPGSLALSGSRLSLLWTSRNLDTLKSCTNCKGL
jgi:hypothetical protein